MEEEKHILVICSSLRGLDFNQELNNNLKKELFGENPIYTFCNGMELFPECPNTAQTYDFIWFAGCNIIQNLFLNFGHINIVNNSKIMNYFISTINKLKQIIKPNGYLFFTETPNYLKHYKLPSDKSLTILIDYIDEHSKKFGGYNERFHKILILYFKYIFIEYKLGNHLVYKLNEKSVNNAYLPTLFHNMKAGGSFTVYDMLIGNPSIFIEKNPSKKYNWMNKVRIVYKTGKISSKTGFYNGDGKIIFKKGGLFTSEEGDFVSDQYSDGIYDYNGYIILDKTYKILKKNKLFSCLKDKNIFNLLKKFYKRNKKNIFYQFGEQYIYIDGIKKDKLWQLENPNKNEKNKKRIEKIIDNFYKFACNNKAK